MFWFWLGLVVWFIFFGEKKGDFVWLIVIVEYRNLFKWIFAGVGMKNWINYVIVTLLLASLGIVSAAENETLIIGRIYNPTTFEMIGGADVRITCNESIVNVVSLSNGKYSYRFDQNDCSAGNYLNVYAEKGGLTGSVDGTINEQTTNLDLGIVNVPLVPEFGFIIGVFTLLSAVGVFFVIRKE